MQNSAEIALDYSLHVILTGDINIDFSNLTNSRLRDCMSTFSYKSLIRFTRQLSTLINPLIVAGACIVLDSGNFDMDEFLGDYKATYVSIQIDLNLSNS